MDADSMNENGEYRQSILGLARTELSLDCCKFSGSKDDLKQTRRIYLGSRREKKKQQ